MRIAPRRVVGEGGQLPAFCWLPATFPPAFTAIPYGEREMIMSIPSLSDRALGMVVALSADRVAFPAAVIVSLLLASWIAAQLALGGGESPLLLR